MAAFGTRKLKLKVNGVDYSSAVKDVRVSVDKKDSDFTSFADAAAGGAQEYGLKLVMQQDGTAASLWDLMWTSPGTDVAVEIWPNGQAATNPATPTPVYPKFAGTVTVTEPSGSDLLGGEANPSSTAVFETEVTWTFLSRPVKTVA